MQVITPRIVEQRRALFRAEHEVDEDVGERLWHTR
jgi:hypothetical protein